jgi:hypothetical protein
VLGSNDRPAAAPVIAPPGRRKSAKIPIPSNAREQHFSSSENQKLPDTAKFRGEHVAVGRLFLQ